MHTIVHTFRLRQFAVALTIVALAACAAPSPEVQDSMQDTTAEDLAAIDALRDSWADAYNAGNAEALATLYTADAIGMYNQTATLEGPAAIGDHYAAQLAGMTPSTTLTPAETQVAGDWGFDRGTFQGTMAPTAGGDPTNVHGRYIVILQRTTDGWRIARSIDNSAVPSDSSASGGR
jgi:uncharacterized protein (TIGR02246 family)